MRKILSREIFLFVLVFALLSAFGLQAYAQTPEEEYIIIVGDVSQSVIESSLVGNMKNALKLAVDLAPNNASLALVTVDTEIQESTSFLKMSDSSNRQKVKEIIDSSVYDGGTNLVLGIEAAVEIAGNDPGRIIMLADISDGALTRANNYDEMTQRANALASEAKEKGIIIDLILVGTPDLENPLVSAYTSFPEQTGGTFQLLDHSKDMASAVESLYFENYAYNMLPISGINSTDKEQQIDIALPTAQILRSRIYVSAATPVKGIRAAYAAADLGSEMNTAYAMIDVDRPVQDGMTLYLDMGDRQTAKVYLIADYDMDTLITTSSELVEVDQSHDEQHTTIRILPVDRISGKPILSETEMAEFLPEVTLVSPSGKTEYLTFKTEDITNSSFQTSYTPKEYGEYQIQGRLTNGTFSFPIESKDFTLEEVVEKGWLTSTLALIIGAFLILSALFFYFYKKRKNRITNEGAVELERYHQFTGKLHFTTLIAEGGKREIQPFTFYLDQIKDRKRLSFAEIYTAGSVPDTFIGLDKIWITPGPNQSMILKNNSKATMVHSGREFGYREKIQLFYNDKIFIVFEKDEDEIELIYKRTIPVEPRVTGSKISISVS